MNVLCRFIVVIEKIQSLHYREIVSVDLNEILVSVVCLCMRRFGIAFRIKGKIAICYVNAA